MNLAAHKPSFDDTGSITCRAAGDVKLAQNKSFTEYIVNAMHSELQSQGIINDKDESIIGVKLQKVDFTTKLGATNWFIDGEYTLVEKLF